MRKSIDGAMLDAAFADAMKRSDKQTDANELEWYAFPQTWSSTALGFGGMGGSMVTTATTLIVFSDHDRANIYFDGRWAYGTSRVKALKFLNVRKCPSINELLQLQDKDDPDA